MGIEDNLRDAAKDLGKQIADAPKRRETNWRATRRESSPAKQRNGQRRQPNRLQTSSKSKKTN